MTIVNALQANVAAVNPPTGSTGPKTAQDRKLEDAAQQFEAIFLQELLKPFSSGSGDGLAGDETEKVAGSDTLSSFGTEAVAKSIAKGGGFGIARQLVEKVSLERAQHARANG